MRSLILLAALTTGTVFPFVAVLMAYYVRYVMHTEDASVMGSLMSTSTFMSRCYPARRLLHDSRG